MYSSVDRVHSGPRGATPHPRAAAWAQEGREELLHVQGQEGHCEEIPPVQGKEQQTTAVFLPCEPHEQYEKAK